MNDNTTLRMMIATAALAAVAALFAGGANAMLLDVEGGSGGGASAVPATQPQTIPYLSHGIGVDESQFSGQASSKLTGVHAGRKSLGLTGDSALTRVDRGSQVADDGLDPAIRTAIARTRPTPRSRSSSRRSPTSATGSASTRPSSAVRRRSGSPVTPR